MDHIYKFGTFGYNAKIGKCDEVFYQHQNGFIPYGIIILLVGFFLPSILIIVSYIFIGINLELRKRKTEKIQNMQTQVELPWIIRKRYDYERPERPVDTSRMQPIWFRSIGRCIPPEESRFMLAPVGIEVTGISLVFKNNLRYELKICSYLKFLVETRMTCRFLKRGIRGLPNFWCFFRC